MAHFLGAVPLMFQPAAGFNATGNGTGRQHADNFPAGVMDSFLASAGMASPLMQILLFVHRTLASQLGLDPSLILTLLGFFWAVSKIASQTYGLVAGFVDRHFMCAIYVSEYDQIYGHLMKWLSQQQSIRSSQYLMAQTVWKSAWEEEEELETALFLTDAGDSGGERKYLNFSNQAAKSGPRYVPAMGVTSFWHKGTYFRVHRKRESFMATSGWGGMKDLEEIRISCYGRSIEPLKRLLADAKDLYYVDLSRKTTIYRPKPKELRRDHSLWHQVAKRPIRPMQTVVLQKGEKERILTDLNEYLHPSTPSWYASRGIPLRRGYLFHGPPGTGKTSFSFALGGVFGIDIYVISLQDVNVTEEDLALLFTGLPRRCIVLLEDIDSAGLRRNEDDDEETMDEGEHQEGKTTNKRDDLRRESAGESEEDVGEHGSGGSDDDDVQLPKKQKAKAKDKARESKSGANKKKKKTTSQHNISLSGLLNAIDGVASHEGRALIMTTNKPEALDEALIRPGRVDVQVAFKNATSQQASELFFRMYEEVSPRQPVRDDGAACKKAAAAEKDDVADRPATNTAPSRTRQGGVVTVDQVRAIAAKFGEQIPDGALSPAEIQGFLLNRKKDPRKALEDVTGWVEALITQKATHSKVATVQ